LHVAFTRHRATARMFVQDIEVLRKTANRSIIDQVTARDLEAIARQNRIEQMIERAFEQARSVAQRVKSVVQRRIRAASLILRVSRLSASLRDGSPDG
jgi:hypothetical protein